MTSQKLFSYNNFLICMPVSNNIVILNNYFNSMKPNENEKTNTIMIIINMKLCHLSVLIRKQIKVYL